MNLVRKETIVTHSTFLCFSYLTAFSSMMASTLLLHHTHTQSNQILPDSYSFEHAVRIGSSTQFLQYPQPYLWVTAPLIWIRISPDKPNSHWRQADLKILNRLWCIKLKSSWWYPSHGSSLSLTFDSFAHLTFLRWLKYVTVLQRLASDCCCKFSILSACVQPVSIALGFAG